MKGMKKKIKVDGPDLAPGRAQRLRYGTAVSILAILCACNPAPKYVRPPAPVPQTFKEASQQYQEGAGWHVAKPEDDKIRGNWWEMYHDSTLNELEQQVRISNQTIKIAEANYRAAQALVVTARSALFPTATASISYTNEKFGSTRGGALVTGASGVPR